MAAITLAAALMAGCGGDDSEDETTVQATTEETTGTTGATGATGAGEAGGAPAEEELTACLEDLGYSVDTASGFDADYGLQVDSGVAAGGGEVYVYPSKGDLDAGLSDIEGAYQFSKAETVGTAVLLYSEEQTDVRDDVTECLGG